MTRVLAVDAKNDLYIAEDGNLAIHTGLLAVMQACAQAVKTQFGSVVLQTNIGVPSFELIWSGTPNLLQYDVFLRRAILSVPDVLEVVSLDIQAADNKVTYQATIRTIYGPGVVNG